MEREDHFSKLSILEKHIFVDSLAVRNEPAADGGAGRYS